MNRSKSCNEAEYFTLKFIKFVLDSIINNNLKLKVNKSPRKKLLYCKKVLFNIATISFNKFLLINPKIIMLSICNKINIIIRTVSE